MWIWISYERYTEKCWIMLWCLPRAPVHNSVFCSICSLQRVLLVIPVWLSQPRKPPGMWILLNHWVSTHCLWIACVCRSIFPIYWRERALCSVFPLFKIVLHNIQTLVFLSALVIIEMIICPVCLSRWLSSNSLLIISVHFIHHLQALCTTM